ncbi:MAG TPA: glycosyltransferase family 4 protein [Acidobacteriota bacterium]|nr:glycosyltransferase family 4 protein [Acidobacteriota bacterium]
MAQGPKILILTHNFPRFRGDFSGVFVELLARRLVQHGMAPVVLAPHDAGAARREESEGVLVRRFPYAPNEGRETLAYRGNMHDQVWGSVLGPLRFLRFLRAFRKAATETVREEQVELLAGHWLVPAGIVMSQMRPQLNLPMVLSSHGTDIRMLSRYRRLAYPYFRNLLYSLDRWTVVSSFLKDAVLEIDPNLADRIDLLPLPHDEKLFYRDEGIEREKGLVVSVTRFTEQKRVGHLLRAFATVREKTPSARLELYGSGPLQTDLESLIRNLHLDDCTKIMPPVPQEKLREVYNRAAIVVLNSFREGFGLTLSEAMLCGAPVIGTRSGGIVDIISHEQTGLLVQPDDVQELSRTIERLLSDDGLRHRLARAGQGYAGNTYASGPLAARYAGILQDALRRRPDRSG